MKTIPLDFLDIPLTGRAALIIAGWTELIELGNKSDDELLALRGFGYCSLKRLRESLEQIGWL